MSKEWIKKHAMPRVNKSWQDVSGHFLRKTQTINGALGSLDIQRCSTIIFAKHK